MTSCPIRLLPVALAVLCIVPRALAAAPSQEQAAAPLQGQPVDDATLAQQRGKYYGADMLVGLRIDLVSTLAGPNGTALATGSLYVRRVGNGFDVYVDTHAAASDNGAPIVDAGNVATGGEAITVHGIGQVSQIAGDGNLMANIASIRLLPNGSIDTSGFNGAPSSDANAGGMTAHISFLDGGVQLGVGAPGAGLSQQLRDNPAGGGQLLQLGQLAGNGFVGSNQLQLQVLGAAMPAQLLAQLGVRQALSGLSGLGH